MEGTKEGKMYVNIGRSQGIRRGITERESRGCRNSINREAQKARGYLINGLKWTDLWNLSWKLVMLVLLILQFSQEFPTFHLVIDQCRMLVCWIGLFTFTFSYLSHFIRVPTLTGPLTEEHVFLLSPDSSVHQLVRVQLCNLKASIFWTPNRVSVEFL